MKDFEVTEPAPRPDLLDTSPAAVDTAPSEAIWLAERFESFKSCGHKNADGEPLHYQAARLLRTMQAELAAVGQSRNDAIREAMAAIAETESRKQALEIMEGLITP